MKTVDIVSSRHGFHFQYREGTACVFSYFFRDVAEGIETAKTWKRFGHLNTEEYNQALNKLMGHSAIPAQGPASPTAGTRYH